MQRNPLRSDPSRCATTRRVFAAEVRRHFAVLRRSLRRLIVDDDAFGLTPDSLQGRWRFFPDHDKMEAFQTWLEAVVRQAILSPSGEPWWQRHVASAYAKGLNRAFDDVRKPVLHGSGEISGARAEFLRQVLSDRPAPSSFSVNARHGIRDHTGRFVNKKILALSQRLAVELKGATDAMAQKIARALIAGMERGDSVKAIAGAIDAAVNVGMRRALLIATTEVTRAQAEGQLDGMEAMGMMAVKLVAEWRTTGTACPACAKMDGRTFDLVKARGLIPQHPSCACAWAVVVGGVP